MSSSSLRDVEPARHHGAHRETWRSFVAGKPHGGSGATQPMIDPATGRRWASSILSEQAIGDAVASAADAHAAGVWSGRAGWERAAVLRQLAELIPAYADELAELETLATGKPLVATRKEMLALTRWYHFFAAAAETAEGRRRTLSPTAHAAIEEEPLGVVAAITPFNGAASLGSWKIAPALAAGNAVVVKPPPEAAGSTIRLAEIAIEAGLPPGALNVLVADAAMGEELALDPRVAMVSFTGSTPVAMRLGALVTGRMGRFACEAGGKSAHVIFEDADVEQAAIAVRQGALSATGQTCVAGSRVLVHDAVFSSFAERLKDLVERLRVGDPRAGSTHIGPLASARQLARVRGFVERAIADGARVVAGGSSPELGAPLDGGYWFEPTIVDQVTPDMEICREEVFGPVIALHRFSSDAEAVEVANSVDYGLAAGLWTADAARAHRLSRQLQAGTVWVNTYRFIDWRVPFGGYKRSGLGRENGLEVLREYTQTKAVVTDHGPVADPFPDAAA